MTAIDGRLVSTRTADGVLLHGLLTGPRNPGGVLAVHGAWGNFYATPIADLLRAAPLRGLAGLSMNTRGHDLGTLGDGEPCIGFMRDIFERTPADLDAAVAVLTDYGVERMVAVAHSYGGHKLAYWLAGGGGRSVTGVVLASPAPPLRDGARWFVEGSVEHHMARAASAVAAGEPNRLIVLSSSAPVPVVAEAATVLSTWAPDTLADAGRHVAALEVPLLVTVGSREPSVYRAKAEQVAAAARDAELLVLDDDHYYAVDRARFSETVLDWATRRARLAPTIEREDVAR